MVDQEIQNTAYAEQAQLFKLLAHPARLAILEVLSQDEACVCHIEATLGLRQAYISQQLAVLREAGIILDRRDGWNIFYRLAEPRIVDLIRQVTHILHLEDSPQPPRRPVQCPCPKCNSA